MIIKKEDVQNMLNNVDIETVTYLDTERECLDVTEDEAWLQKQAKEGRAVILPYVEHLYPYNQAMGEYLIDREIEIPDGMRVKAYLAQEGRLEDWYEFREKGLEKKFEEWCKKYNIKILNN